MDPLLSALVLVGGGNLALALATESPQDLGAWLSHARLRPRPGVDEGRARAFWEAVARNSILLGALGAAYGLAALLAGEEVARGGGGERLGEMVLGPPLLGAVAAALAAVPASRRVATRVAAAPLPAAPLSAPRWTRAATAAGYGLLAVVLVALFPSASGRPGLRPREVLLHAPAWIAVAAATVALAVYLGDARRGGSLTVAVGVASGASAAGGLLVALHGFAISRIGPVASGFVFSLSSGVAGLVLLATVALPLEDRAFGRRQCGRCRLVGYGLPLVVVLLCGALWLLASTPMKMRP